MTGVMNRTRSNTLLQVLVLSAGLTGLVDASFWRYRLGIQSGSEDANTCSVPDPMLTIVAGSAQVVLHESTGSASCIVPNNGAGIGLICTGAGSITIDVMKTSSDVADVVTGDSLTVILHDLQSFPCTFDAAPAIQAYTIGQLCPDGTSDYVNNINCFPASALVTGPNQRQFCASSTIDEAFGPGSTTATLPGVATQLVNDGCWFEEDTSVETPTTAPVSVPSAAPVAPPPPTLAPVIPPPTSAPVAPPTTSAPVNPPPTSVPVESTCGGFLTTCSLDTECCSNRCILNNCQKAIPTAKISLSGSRGGAAGVARTIRRGDDRTRRLKSVRGSKKNL